MRADTYTRLPGIKVTRSGGGEMELFASGGSARLLKGFKEIFHREDYGAMTFQYYLGQGFQIWRSEYRMHAKMRVRSRGEVPVLELHIPLEGAAMSWWDGRKENYLRPQQFDLGYVPFVESETDFYPANTCVTLDIHYSVDFLSDFAGRFPIVNEFLSQVDNHKRAHLLHNAVRFLSPAMMELVRDILSYSGMAEFVEEYYQGKVSLLLDMVLARAMNVQQHFSIRRYVDAAVSARELISAQPNIIFTAKDLSLHAGINVSLLHKVFKEYHGAMIFDFSQGVRLEHAKVLLRDTNKYISDIAAECGYPEPPNFTAAFRKRFGFTPQNYRDALKR